jgi:hypothetical protein
VVVQVCEGYAEIVKMKGERTVALDFAILSALAWHAGQKDQALADAEKALEMARSSTDPKTPPVERFERFVEAVRQDRTPPLRDLQAARKAALQTPSKAP